MVTNKIKQKKMKNKIEITPRLVIHENDVRDLDKTAEFCAKLLQPIFGTIYVEKMKNKIEESKQKHILGNICCRGCFELGKQEAQKEFQEKIDNWWNKIKDNRLGYNGCWTIDSEDIEELKNDK